MIKTITPQKMAELEKRIMAENDLPGLLLMEQAAGGILIACYKILGDKKAPKALVLCGPGNNGGDGYAFARQFVAGGGQVIIWQLKGNLKGDALLNKNLFINLYGDKALYIVDDTFPPMPKGIDVIIDGLYGTGLNGEISGIAKALIDYINAFAKNNGVSIIAIDIPSGIHGQSGALMGSAIQADCTVSFHRPKQGLYLGQGPDHAGEIIVWDIGLPGALDHEPGIEILELKDALSLLPKRKKNTHKGDYGKVLIFAGSVGMAGAAALCANGALRAGAGLVQIACDRAILNIVQTLAPCATCIPLDFDNLGGSLDILKKACDSVDSIAAGPGLGAGKEVYLEVIAQSGKLIVWDADALNMLAGMIPGPQKALLIKPNDICTPHPGEGARLLSKSIESIVGDPIGGVIGLNEKLGCTVILKGSKSLIYDGKNMALNDTGTPAMAKGGSGDVLTGILAALLARRGENALTSFQAAQLGCYIHGRAGELAEVDFGQHGLLATDLINYVGKAMA